MARRTLITSGKGGTGKSATAILLGFALTLLNKKVLIIDLDTAVGSVEVLLGEEPCVFNFGDVLEGNCAIKDAINSSSYEMLDFVAAPRKKPSRLSSGGVLSAIKELDNYDVILLDSPAGFDLATWLDESLVDDALIVANPERICLNGARGIVKLLNDKGVPDKRLVLNKFNKRTWQKSKIESLDEVIDFVGARLAAVVPFCVDFELILDDLGKLKRSKRLLGSVMNLANRYDGKEAKLLFN